MVEKQSNPDRQPKERRRPRAAFLLKKFARAVSAQIKDVLEPKPSKPRKVETRWSLRNLDDN